MDQDYLGVTADDVDGVDGCIAALVDKGRGQGVVALAATVILSIRERHNIKLTDPCSGGLATAVKIAGGRYSPTHKCRGLMARHLRRVGAGVLELGTRRTVCIHRVRSSGGRGAWGMTRSPSVPIIRGHVVVMASSCGKPLNAKAGTMCGVDA